MIIIYTFIDLKYVGVIQLMLEIPRMTLMTE